MMFLKIVKVIDEFDLKILANLFNVLNPGFPLGRIFSFLRKFLQLQGKKKEIQNKRKYEGNFKKLKRIEKTLISTNVTLCNYLCNHKYIV